MKRIISIIVIGLILATIYLIYIKESTIKIGFVGSLTERFAKLGNDSLNSVKLAFEEIDYKIGNSKIELIHKDDKQDKSSAKQAIDELLAEDVKVTIGNITSSMTQASLDALKGKDMILLSPTAESQDLINKDDKLLRIPDTYSSKSFEPLLTHLQKNNIKRIFCFYSDGHPTTIKKYLEDFQELFVHSGGEEFIDVVRIEDVIEDRLAKKAPNYTIKDSSIEDLVHKIDDKVDAVLILSGSLVSAKVVQFLKRGGFNKQIITTEWATSYEYLENGGKAIEGTILITDYLQDSQSKKYQEFVKAYEKRFAKTPTSYAMHAYESAKVIIEVLQKDNNVTNLKKNILEQKVFDGLQGKITFNEYGDVSRDYFLIQVKNNRFVKIDE